MICLLQTKNEKRLGDKSPTTNA